MLHCEWLLCRFRTQMNSELGASGTIGFRMLSAQQGSMSKPCHGYMLRALPHAGMVLLESILYLVLVGLRGRNCMRRVQSWKKAHLRSVGRFQ